MFDKNIINPLFYIHRTSVTDEFGGIATKTISFNVSNPDLKLYLTGVNTGDANEATLGHI